MLRAIFPGLCTMLMHLSSFAQGDYHEPYRPQLHFSPRAHWMNDPNGMVYENGTYHLFFQYYPYGTVWGPMHWGHATSRDLVHWQEQPIALYPDSLGYIFSGSAVLKSGSRAGAADTLFAIFTQHDSARAADGRSDYQNQSLGWSTDHGRTWTKYPGNPILRNPGFHDFRDPKVTWYAPGKKWVMTLATGDRVTFYSSPDLRSWTRLSTFGAHIGAHGGVWECPDLFQMGKDWILIVNVNPGGPNGGSATQYFIGSFDGTTFTSRDTQTRWLDYGPDEYAGVTWSNTGPRRIFLGWMSNWQYAQVVPTSPWRSAMTIPRELKVAGGRLASQPVRELNVLADTSSTAPFLPCRFDLKLDGRHDDTITFSNAAGERLVIGYIVKSHSFYIDRTHAGQSDFFPGFASLYSAPRFSNDPVLRMTLIMDLSSVEIFADGGLTTMTATFFPTRPYTAVTGATGNRTALRSIWP